MRKNKKLNQRIGSNIRDIRKSKGWNQEYLAKKLRMTRINITNIELGHSQLTIANLEKLKNVFECNYDAILY